MLGAGLHEDGDRLHVGEGVCARVSRGQRPSGQPGFGRDLCSNSNLVTQLPQWVSLCGFRCAWILVHAFTIGGKVCSACASVCASVCELSSWP